MSEKELKMPSNLNYSQKDWGNVDKRELVESFFSQPEATFPEQTENPDEDPRYEIEKLTLEYWLLGIGAEIPVPDMLQVINDSKKKHI